MGAFYTRFAVRSVFWKASTSARRPKLAVMSLQVKATRFVQDAGVVREVDENRLILQFVLLSQSTTA